MLKKLALKNVGPIQNLDMAFEKRLNIITGDNGLGKSFLLDIIWYVLTRKWPAEINKKLTSGYMARPFNPGKNAKISFELDSEKGKQIEYCASFDRSVQSWTGRPGRPYSAGLVIYAHSNGSFSVWDPARNYWNKRGNVDIQDRQPAFVFSPNEVWDGLEISSPDSTKKNVVCNGLIYDLASWQKDRQCWEFQIMRYFLSKLSPPDSHLDLGELTRISIDDARDIPTVKMSYGEIPILFASAGIRRVFSFVYFLTWALSEHTKACKLLGQKPTRQFTFLFDELEAHLHPKWQRVILNSMLNVLHLVNEKSLKFPPVLDKRNNPFGVQIIAATHSPLVMASLESVFRSDSDSWFDLDFQEKGVILTRREFQKMGNADNWLTSEAFDLKSSRSLEAEKKLSAYNALMEHTNPDKKEREKILHELENLLPETDPFWFAVDYSEKV